MPFDQSASQWNSQSAEFQQAARHVLRLREERKRAFQKIEIVGPAWPLMLALYAADSLPTQLAVGDLAKQAGLPRTTALRWLHRLHRHDVVTLSTDSMDRRVVRVRLTPRGRRGMDEAFAAVAADGPLSAALKN